MEISKIKKYLKENNLTYDDLARMSGIPKQTISKVMCGATANPRSDTVDAIETALGLKNKSEFHKWELSQKQLRLLTAFDCLVPEMQENILSFMENLAAQSGGANADKRGEA